jgi:hypothetical protein
MLLLALLRMLRLMALLRMLRLLYHSALSVGCSRRGCSSSSGCCQLLPIHLYSLSLLNQLALLSCSRRLLLILPPLLVLGCWWRRLRLHHLVVTWQLPQAHEVPSALLLLCSGCALPL